MICTSCGIEKDKSEFYNKGKQCKECIKEKRKSRYENKKLDEGEATSISKPAINLLSKSAFYSKIMENADIVALTGALSFVLLPRIFVTINENKNKNKIDKEEN